MNDIKGVIDESNKEDLPYNVKEYLSFVKKIMFIFHEIKKDELIDVYDIFVPKFSSNSDSESGYESYTETDSTKIEKTNKYSSKDILCLLEDIGIKNMVEQCLQELFAFLYSPNIIYKHSISLIKDCKDIVYQVLKYLEENDTVSYVTSICKVFIVSLWDSFEHGDDPLQLQYVLKIYYELTTFQYLYSTITDLLVDKVLIITKKLKKKKFEPALMYTNNYSYICSSIIFLLTKLMKKRDTQYMPEDLYEKFLEILIILESTDEFTSNFCFIMKIIRNTINYEKMKMEEDIQ